MERANSLACTKSARDAVGASSKRSHRARDKMNMTVFYHAEKKSKTAPTDIHACIHKVRTE